MGFRWVQARVSQCQGTGSSTRPDASAAGRTGSVQVLPEPHESEFKQLSQLRGPSVDKTTGFFPRRAGVLTTQSISYASHPDYKTMNLPPYAGQDVLGVLQGCLKGGTTIRLRRRCSRSSLGTHLLPRVQLHSHQTLQIRYWGWNLDENNRCVNCGYQLPIVAG